MPTTNDTIESLVSHPHESLNVELKGWIDPASPEGTAKIVKACIALRNNDGGYLLIGIDDKTLTPQVADAPDDVLTMYHPDRLQALIAKYSSQPFEIHVHFVAVSGVKIPVIEIESGVRSPVAAKADLKAGDKRLLQCNRVYTRTLNSNNTVSTSEASWMDWERLSELCFRNREADIGAFMRRHLSGLSRDSIATLGNALLHGAAPPPTVDEIAREYLDACIHRFEVAVNGRVLPANLPAHGTWECAACIDPPLDSKPANQDFLNLVLTRNPGYSGWPVWMDSRGFPEKADRPYVMDRAWEALIVSEPLTTSWHLDFWRIQPDGKFYLRRGLQEDLWVGDKALPKGTILDFMLPVVRTTEALAVALQFAQALDAPDSRRQLVVACRWKDLRDRELRSWADQSRSLFPGRRCQQSELVSTTVLPVSSVATSLAEPVERLVAPLFELFEGFQLKTSVFEELTQKVITRRL